MRTPQAVVGFRVQLAGLADRLGEERNKACQVLGLSRWRENNHVTKEAGEGGGEQGWGACPIFSVGMIRKWGTGSHSLEAHPGGAITGNLLQAEANAGLRLGSGAKGSGPMDGQVCT